MSFLDESSFASDEINNNSTNILFLEEEDDLVETDVELVSLEDTELCLLSLDDISPEPARGDIYDSDTDSFHSLSLEDGESGHTKKYRYRKSLIPTQEQLTALALKDGENEIVFQLEG